MSFVFRGASAGAGSLFSRLAVSVLIGAALVLPAQAYDLQYRQNGTSFSASELRRIFNNGLPAAYDQQFPDQRWTTYLLLDAHADKGLGAILLPGQTVLERAVWRWPT